MAEESRKNVAITQRQTTLVFFFFFRFRDEKEQRKPVRTINKGRLPSIFFSKVVGIFLWQRLRDKKATVKLLNFTRNSEGRRGSVTSQIKICCWWHHQSSYFIYILIFFLLPWDCWRSYSKTGNCAVCDVYGFNIQGTKVELR